MNFKGKLITIFLIALIFLFIFNYLDAYISSLFLPKKGLIKLNLNSKHIVLYKSFFNFSVENISFFIHTYSEHDIKSFIPVTFNDWGGNTKIYLSFNEVERIKYLSSKKIIIKKAIILGNSSNLILKIDNSNIILDIINPESIKIDVYYDISDIPFPFKVNGDISVNTEKLGRTWYGYIVPSIYKSGKLISISNINLKDTFSINIEKLMGNFNTEELMLYRVKGNIFILKNHTLLGHDYIKTISADPEMHININSIHEDHINLNSKDFFAYTWINDEPIPKNKIHSFISTGYYSIPSIITGIISGLIIEGIKKIFVYARKE